MADLSTAGIKFAWAVETTEGTKPSSFKAIKGAKAIPEMNPEPSTLETTSLDATVWKTYIAGLKDPGGAIGITFNDNDELHESWKAFHEAYEAAKASNLATWVEFYVPNMAEGFFMTVDVTELGFGGAEVDAVLETTGYIVPNGNIGWATAIKPN